MNGMVFMRKNLGALQRIVVKLSESNYWEEAVDEWDILDCSIDDKMKEICICGHEGLRYCFTIQNRYNNNILYPIGSSCILQFGRKDLNQTVSIYDQLFHIRKKYYNNEKITLKDFSRKLLQFFLDEDVFKATQYNNYNSENDYNFMLQMFNQRSGPTNRQQSKINAIIVNNIIPYIQKMEK